MHPRLSRHLSHVIVGLVDADAYDFLDLDDSEIQICIKDVKGTMQFRALSREQNEMLEERAASMLIEAFKNLPSFDTITVQHSPYKLGS